MAVAEAAVATSSETSNTTSHDVSLPSGIVAGSLVLVFFAHDGATSNVITWPAGWTPLLNDAGLGTQCGFEVGARFCDGGEGSTIVVTTSGSEQSIHRAVRLTGHHSAHLPEIAMASGTSETPDPPSLSPTWGSAEESLLYAAFANDNGNRTLDSAPAAYDATDVYATSAGGGGVGLGVGRRNASVASEDPGSYDISAIQVWISATIAIRPSSADELAAPTDLGSATNSSTLTTVAAAPSDSRVIMEVYWYGTATCTGASDNEEGLTWVIDAQERGTNAGDQNQAILSADAPSGLTSGAVITPTFSAAVAFGPGMAAQAWEGLEGGATGYLDDAVTAVTEDFNEIWTSEGVTSTGEGLAIGFSLVGYTPGEHRPIGDAEADEWNVEGGQYGAVVWKILGGAATVTLQGRWTTDVSFQQNIAVVYKKAAGGGTTHQGAFALPISFGATVAGSRTAKGAFSLPIAFGAATVGRKTARGSFSLPIALGADIVGRKTARGSFSLPVTFGAEVAGSRTAKGSTSATFTFNAATVGSRTAHAVVAAGFTFGVTTVGRKTARGSLSLPITFGAVTRGTGSGQETVPTRTLMGFGL